MAQMNPQFGAPPLGIPSYQQMQAAFNSIGQQQQMWYNNQYQQFQIFCQTRGLNPNDPNSFPLFYQQMISNINNQQPHSPQVFPPPQPPQVFPPSQPPQFFPPSSTSTTSNNPSTSSTLYSSKSSWYCSYSKK